jgi:hypothetical protein
MLKLSVSNQEIEYIKEWNWLLINILLLLSSHLINYSNDSAA